MPHAYHENLDRKQAKEKFREPGNEFEDLTQCSELHECIANALMHWALKSQALWMCYLVFLLHYAALKGQLQTVRNHIVP